MTHPEPTVKTLEHHIKAALAAHHAVHIHHGTRHGVELTAPQEVKPVNNV